ncbi:MAG: hypothetical protein QG622_2564, partial [Actinomycetota bacterium]|nr:hypothetical protein [Actinomycetota bacterium]
AGPVHPAGPAEPVTVRARRFAGHLKRRLEGRPVALPPRSAQLTPGDLDGATVVVTDCQSMPVARRLLAVAPDVRMVVELDRGGVLGPPPDSAETEGS